MKTSASNPFWAVVSLLILAIFVLGHIVLAKVRPCLPEADCQSYIAMVNHWGFNADLLPHHAMRVLPSMAAWGLIETGLSLPFAFQVLSATAYCLFAWVTWALLERFHPDNRLNPSMVLLLLSAHWVMIQPLSQVYQASDGWTYPLGILMVGLVHANRPGALCLVTLIGILVRQNLFVLGFLALCQLGWRYRQKRIIGYLALVLAMYWGVTQYYQAGGALLAHIIPTKDFFTIAFWDHFLGDSDILYLFLALTPFFLFYTRQMAVFFERHVYLLLYAGIVIGQPLVAYDMTGQANFVRIAMQGVWPFYLAAAWAVASTKLDTRTQVLIAGYCLLMATTWSQSMRIFFVALLCFALGGLWWLSCRKSVLSLQS